MKAIIKIVIFALLFVFASSLIIFLSIWYQLPTQEEYSKLLNNVNGQAKIILYDCFEEEIASEKEGEFVYISLSELPPKMIDDIIFFEDGSFNYNLGFSISGIVRAILYDKGGGSTIAQQCVRILSDQRELAYKRKLIEIVSAIKLTLSASKEEILQYYVNHSYFQSRARFGIYAGSKYWFDKHPSRLTRAESLFLICLLSGKKNIKDKYLKAVNRLIDEGVIDFETKNFTNIVFGPKENRGSKSLNSYNVFVDKVIAAIVNNQETINSLYYNGLNVKTSLDKLATIQIGKIIDNHFDENKKKYIDGIVFMLIDKEGNLRIENQLPMHIPGSFSFSESNNIMPGSRIKGSIYATSFEELFNMGLDEFRIRTLRLPSEYKYKSGKRVIDTWAHGEGISLDTALAKSANASALYLSNQIITPLNIVDKLYQFNINMKPFESISLGSQNCSETNIFKLYYCLLNNNGKSGEIKIIVDMTESKSDKNLDRNSVIENKSQIFSERSSKLFRKLLEGTAEFGTGKILNTDTILAKHSISIKTGTSAYNGIRHIGVTGAIDDFTFTLMLQQSKKNIGSSSILIPLLTKLLRHLVDNGYLEVYKQMLENINEVEDEKSQTFSSNVSTQKIANNDNLKNKILLIYTVKKGDNLNMISKSFGVEVTDICEWNELKSNKILKEAKLKLYQNNETAFYNSTIFDYIW